MGSASTPRNSSAAEWSDLLDRYYAGECHADERAAVEAYLAPRPRMARFFDALRRVLDGTSAGQFDAMTGLQRIKHVPASLKMPLVQDRRSSIRLGWGRSAGPQTLQRWLWSTAVITVLGVVAIVMGLNMNRLHFGQHTASMMTYTTGNGERATVALPDGETVTLNVASRLEVPMDYMSGHRTVRLLGEGLFTVFHHAGSPLTVLAGGTATRVLGTSFVVRHYATDTSAIVAVRDGKVAIGQRVVTANQMVEIGPSGVPDIRVVAASLFSFATGVLTINGMPLTSAIVELDRWYDADIRLADPRLAKRHMQGTFRNGSLGELAEALELTYDVRVVREGRVLTLYPIQ